VWYGNDDYSPLNRMTGGALPAMTWHEIMSYAHQGVELKNIPGLPANPATTAPAIADGSAKDEPPRPVALTSRGKQVLVRLERMLEDAGRGLLAVRPPPGPRASAEPAETLAAASGRRSATVRGN
jgi:penicillin-binding protein 1A